MSNVVISNRSIFNQRINNIDKNRVVLPFNVTKEQKDKLIKLLESTTIEFVNEIDKLEISKFIFGNIEVKSVRDIANSTFTLSKSYVATMKQNIISNVDAFYKKLKEQPKTEEAKVEKPIFVHTEDETNLKQALAEATAELDLSELQTKTNVVLANSQMEDKELQVDSSIVSENVEPIVPQEVQPVGQTPVVNPTPAPVVNTEPAPVVEQQVSVSQQPILTEQPKPVVEQSLTTEPQPIANQQPTILPEQTVQQPQMVQPPQEYVENTVMPEQPKVKKKLFSRKGNILIIPLIVLWLGLVLFGSIKLVTSILT